MSAINKDIIIMAYSEIADRMAETQHGNFESIRDAEVHGYRAIRGLRWRVAYRVTRTKDNGSTEIEHEFLTALVDPRRRED